MANEKPLFSILIPTTGRTNLIRMAIESVCKQTYQDFEIVVADLSVSDEAERAATDFGDERIHYIRVPEGENPYATFDYAYKHSLGKYVLWLDDDNYLLPYALELLKNAIHRTGADMVTASHFYYYDNKHPLVFLKNSLGIVPFIGGEHSIDPKGALQAFFSFSRRGPGKPYPRFHLSATAVSRAVVDRVYSRLDYIALPDVPNLHSVAPILLAFAKTCIFIDYPIAIVGRIGLSMSQTWSTAARARFKKNPFHVLLSPVIGYTRINGVLENYLRLKKLLPDMFKDVSINYDRFAEIYVTELAYLDMEIVTAIKAWKNLFAFLQTLSPEIKKKLIPEARKRAFMYPVVYLARRLRLHYTRRRIHGVYTQYRHTSGMSPRERLYSMKEFEISLRGHDVDSIVSLAHNLRKILSDTFGEDVLKDAYRQEGEK